MAKAWRATTTIKAGKAGTFSRGDIVTGLTKENMKQLWEAGALEAATVEDPAPAGSGSNADNGEQDKNPAPPAATGADATGGTKE